MTSSLTSHCNLLQCVIADISGFTALGVSVQDEREELLKSLREKKALKERLASELAQYKDCDPATITHIRTYMCILHHIVLNHLYDRWTNYSCS